VADVGAAERAYVEGLGFEVLSSSGEQARLEKDGLVLVLSSSRSPAAPEDCARVYLNLETRDLDESVGRALVAGFEVPEPEPEAIAIGRAVRIVDADGFETNLIELARSSGESERTAGPDEDPRVFNIGLQLEPDADWEFVERLGFEVLTRAYLPDALPIARRGAAELVLQRQARGPRPGGARAAALLLAVDRLEPGRGALEGLGFVDPETPPRSTPSGRRATLEVPSGVRIELVERSPAQLAFERLGALAGSWEGRSSAGWTARSEIEVIARGSAVVERTNFEAHPGEAMLTVFHRDGAELVLTHYCVAGNQPRLVASSIAPQGEALELHFTFRDATNLASRAQGHMDEARFHLRDEQGFSSTWSFAQSGSTSWMEAIEYRRRTPVAMPDPGR